MFLRKSVSYNLRQKRAWHLRNRIGNMTPSADFVLEQFAIAKNLYLLGTFEKGLTIYNQQVRALNLVWAMIQTAPKAALRKVAVIGGGFAGLTAAAGLLEKG